MSWYLVVLITQMHDGLYQGFMWYDPKFKNKQQCIEWVNDNPVSIIQSLSSEFDNWQIHQTLCVREDRLQDIGLKPYIPGEKT